MLRKILSIIAGYMIFAVSAALLFNLTGQPPHQDAPLSFKLMTLIYGVFFSVIAGYVLQLIAAQQNLTLNYILTLLMFVLAGISLLTSGGSHWTQLFAMFIFAPASVMGGYLKLLLMGRSERD